MAKDNADQPTRTGSSAKAAQSATGRSGYPLIDLTMRFDSDPDRRNPDRYKIDPASPRRMRRVREDAPSARVPRDARGRPRAGGVVRRRRRDAPNEDGGHRPAHGGNFMSARTFWDRGSERRPSKIGSKLR
jgi:hypothetical protein